MQNFHAEQFPLLLRTPFLSTKGRTNHLQPFKQAALTAQLCIFNFVVNPSSKALICVEIWIEIGFLIESGIGSGIWSEEIGIFVVIASVSDSLN